jgi:hypothetical protein
MSISSPAGLRLLESGPHGKHLADLTLGRPLLLLADHFRRSEA